MNIFKLIKEAKEKEDREKAIVDMDEKIEKMKLLIKTKEDNFAEDMKQLKSALNELVVKKAEIEQGK